MNACAIRKAVHTDARGVAELQIAGWRDSYSKILSSEYLTEKIRTDRISHWQSVLTNIDEREVTFVMESRGNLAGFICVKLAKDPFWGAYVDSLHVSEISRGKGAGKALLQQAALWIQKRAPDSSVYLWVFEENRRAVAFYQNLGGKIVERTTSDMPNSNGAPVLRISWMKAEQLV